MHSSANTPSIVSVAPELKAALDEAKQVSPSIVTSSASGVPHKLKAPNVSVVLAPKTPIPSSNLAHRASSSSSLSLPSSLTNADSSPSIDLGLLTGLFSKNIYTNMASDLVKLLQVTKVLPLPVVYGPRRVLSQAAETKGLDLRRLFGVITNVYFARHRSNNGDPFLRMQITVFVPYLSSSSQKLSSTPHESLQQQSSHQTSYSPDSHAVYSLDKSRRVTPLVSPYMTLTEFGNYTNDVLSSFGLISNRNVENSFKYTKFNMQTHRSTSEFPYFHLSDPLQSLEYLFPDFTHKLTPNDTELKAKFQNYLFQQVLPLSRFLQPSVCLPMLESCYQINLLQLPNGSFLLPGQSSLNIRLKRKRHVPSSSSSSTPDTIDDDTATAAVVVASLSHTSFSTDDTDVPSPVNKRPKHSHVSHDQYEHHTPFHSPSFDKQPVCTRVTYNSSPHKGFSKDSYLHATAAAASSSASYHRPVSFASPSCPAYYTSSHYPQTTIPKPGPGAYSTSSPPRDISKCISDAVTDAVRQHNLFQTQSSLLPHDMSVQLESMLSQIKQQLTGLELFLQRYCKFVSN